MDQKTAVALAKQPCRDFREAQQRNGTGDAADASGRDAPKACAV
jgi:hypothetical protein